MGSVLYRAHFFWFGGNSLAVVVVKAGMKYVILSCQSFVKPRR